MTNTTPIQSFARIGVIGGGAWGTALAQTLRLAGRDVILWARDAALATEITASHENKTYLPGVTLDAHLHATADLARAASADLILLVTPAQTTAAMGRALKPHVRAGVPIVICAKGIEQTTGRRLSTVLAAELPGAPLAVLSGPGFAADVVRGLPTAVTLACADEALGASLAATIGYRNFRIYWTDDVAGVELGGSVKNVLAIAAGIAEGKKLGASAHAALVTRGFAELRRFGAALGAKPATLQGLSGLGDLLLTCGSPQSRNMSLGRGLGEGRTLADILGSRRSVSEGVATAAAVVALARQHKLDLPIAEAVHAICTGTLTVDAAMAALLARPFRAED
jgi:glycerol-3-phosphate dehydrogenase (NAD(P)+)